MTATIIKSLLFDMARNDNYFAGNYSYNDHIVLERQLDNSFPIFKEEWNEEDDVQKLQTGYFDLNLSLMETVKSRLGLNLYEFFNRIEDIYYYKEKYLIVVETGSRTYSGVIEKGGGIVADMTFSDNRYHVNLQVTGIEKEAVEYLKQIKLRRFDEVVNPDFEDDYLPNWHFKDINPLLGLSTQLDISSKVGNQVLFWSGLQRELFDQGYNESGLSVWDGLKSFMLTLGIAMKVVKRNAAGSNSPFYELVLFFRSDGFNNIGSISRYIKHRKSYMVTTGKYFFIPTAHANGVANENEEIFHGLLYGNNFEMFTDFSSGENAILHQIDNKIYSLLIAPTPIVVDSSVNVINQFGMSLTLRNHLGYTWNCPYARCLLEAGQPGARYDRIIKSCAIPEYQRLLEGTKARKELKLKIEDDMNLVVGSKAVIDSKEYICDRINSFDDLNKVMDTEWIQS